MLTNNYAMNNQAMKKASTARMLITEALSGKEKQKQENK